MSHMVIYRGSDGKPGYHQTDDIHDAVGFVERMRNDNGVEHARIFRLEEVVFEYKPYYRVELSDGTVVSQEAAALDGSDAVALPGDSVPSEIGAAPVGNGGTNGSAAAPNVEDSGSAVAVVEDAVEDGPKRGLFGR